MTKLKYERFFELLDEIVNSDGSWISRKQLLEDNASDQDKSNLKEFAAWFT